MSPPPTHVRHLADFTVRSYHPSPFFVLDEVDAALDNTNVARVARYVQNIAGPSFQCVSPSSPKHDLAADFPLSALADSSSSV